MSAIGFDIIALHQHMTRNAMKHQFNATLTALLIALVLALPTASAQSVDRIVAVVGDNVVLASELADAVAQARSRLGARADRISPNALKSNVLDQLILAQLQVNRAKQLGLSVSKQEINRGMARLAQRNGMDANEFVRTLKQRGIAVKAMRQRVREKILIGKVRKAQVASQVKISQQDVTQFLESRSLRSKTNREFHIRHIRLDVPVEASSQNIETIREQAKTLRQRIVSGELTFAAAAKTHSDGNDASRGGDMGWIGAAVMPQVFTDILPQLDQGDVSRVFRGNGAFNLVKLVAARGSQNLAGGRKVMVDQVKVRHIVLRPNALRNKARTHELAAGLKERLVAGANFADLARQYSDDKATANQGGSLGWIQSGMLGPRQAVQLTRMQPGDISPILQTKRGFAIVKLEARRQVDKTREAIRRQARQTIGRRKAEEKGRRWLHKLRDEAYVDIRLPGYQPFSG